MTVNFIDISTTETTQIYHDENAHTSREVEHGYIRPTLSYPEDARVRSAVAHIESPRWFLRSLRQFQKDQNDELVDADTINSNIRDLVALKSGPVLKEMRAALERAKSDLTKLQHKRTDVYKARDAVEESRLGIIRNELMNMCPAPSLCTKI